MKPVTSQPMLGGPIFEPIKSRFWKSLHNKAGAHYNNYACHDEDGMDALRDFFPDGKADSLNFCLFSTSGIHGMYTTIEEAEKWVLNGRPESGEPMDEDDDGPTQVTFLIVQSRICCVRGGNCNPSTPEDFDFLKSLRASSWEAMQKIGRAD